MLLLILSLFALALASPPEHEDVQAIGRNLQIGSLYDVRSSRELSEDYLWSQQTVEDHVATSHQFSTKVEVSSKVRVLDRCMNYGLSSNFALDFMSGLVHSEGAAGYLVTGVDSKYQISVALLYSSTKMRKFFPKSTPVDNIEECSNQEGTHAVTDVTYGVECILDFNYFGDRFENINMIKGELEIAVNNIPTFSITGGGLVNLTETQQAIVEKSSLLTFCDASASGISPPTDYDQAISFYNALPSLAGTEEDDYAGTVVIDAHLTPITDICTAADVVVNQISNALVEGLTHNLDNFEKLSIEIGTLTKSSAANLLPALRKNLVFYDAALQQYTLDIKVNLQHILPNVRGGFGMGEDDIFEMLNQIAESAFEYSKSSHFLANREREVKAISNIIHGFPRESNIAIIDYEMGTDIDFILKYEDIVIVELNILSPTSITEKFLNDEEVDEDDFVYNQDGVLAEINVLVDKFAMFALENVYYGNDKGYLLDLNVIQEDGNPTKVVALHQGQTVSSNFEIPSSPEKTNPTIIAGILFAFQVLKESEFTTGCIVTLVDIAANSAVEKKYDFPSTALAGEDVEIVFEPIQPCTLYSFHIVYVTDFGYGPPSQESDQFFTDNHQCNK